MREWASTTLIGCTSLEHHGPRMLEVAAMNRVANAIEQQGIKPSEDSHG